MIFQHTYEKVMSGAKTQTRRIKRAGDETTIADIPDLPHAISQEGVYVHIPEARLSDARILTVERYGRPHWSVGKTYAVQPGRGKSAVGRIRITGIREQDVREISNADAIAEGFTLAPKYEFLQVWTGMHDPAVGNWLYATKRDPYQPDHCPVFLLYRPVERYQAWVLEFELVRP